jgi:hypothetical protein
MQKAIDRVMQTYGLLVNLTAEQEQVAREKVQVFSQTPVPATKTSWRSRAFVTFEHLHGAPTCRPSLENERDFP